MVYSACTYDVQVEGFQGVPVAVMISGQAVLEATLLPIPDSLLFSRLFLTSKYV